MTQKLSVDLDPTRFSNLAEVFEYSCERNKTKLAFSAFNKSITYGELASYSDKFASFLIHETDLVPGDRIALQLLNVLQFPVALFGAIKAGLVVVNTNPLYTAREMQHQFADSGAKAIVILSAFCDKLEKILGDTEISTVIVTQIGDLQSPTKRLVLNLGAKYIKKIIPAYNLPDAIDFNKAVGYSDAEFVNDHVTAAPDDTALLLYTGGTTGVAKGAELSHRNLISNMMQLRSVCLPVVNDGEDTVVAPLPLYHSYAFMFNCLAMVYAGNHNLLIPNPRDIDGFIKTLQKYPFHGFVGINTLYLALSRHKDIGKVDFSNLRYSGAGGMPLTISVAENWSRVSNCDLFEGYGLTECSPVVSLNPPGKIKIGTVGLPVPETQVKLMSDSGVEVGPGERGELWVKGPQVMKGYWQRPQETEEVLTPDGWLKTGDYAEIQADGYITIVDRKKDMIIVSGFNVFPNEVEEVVNSHPKILESAAIGIANERTGEAVKLFVVATDETLKEDEIISWCRDKLTAYKVPKQIVFADDLPKSNIGKIIRRELR